MGKLSHVADLIKRKINISFNNYFDTCEARNLKLTRLSNLFHLRPYPLDQLFPDGSYVLNIVRFLSSVFGILKSIRKL